MSKTILITGASSGFGAMAARGLAQSYALELARFGIETTIVVPGAFTKGTLHFEHATHPTTKIVPSLIVPAPTPRRASRCSPGLPRWSRPMPSPRLSDRRIVEIVALPHGQRPFRVHIDPSEDGAEIVNGTSDRASSIARTDRPLRSPSSFPPTQLKGLDMPFANFKVPEAALTRAQKEEIVHRTTAMLAEYFSEAARPHTMVLIEEVKDGGYARADEVFIIPDAYRAKE